MKVLLTGASSFTGAWIADALAARGFSVTCVFTGKSADYSGRRAERMRWIAPRIKPVFETPFGSDAFLALVRREQADILALHGAEVANYRSWDFDALAAAAANTRNIRAILEAFARAGRLIAATGSVFEPFEGAGDPERRAFSPYGLSKHLSFEIFRMEAARARLPIAKFVIANPFGPLEEPRFTSFLIRECAAGRAPSIMTPLYVRDNIHVDLLAATYPRFLDRALAGTAMRFSPSGYIESQGAFARRFLREIGARLGATHWRAQEAQQTEFAEPPIRVNDMPAAQLASEWSEDAAWDRLADYYRTALAKGDL